MGLYMFVAICMYIIFLVVQVCLCGGNCGLVNDLFLLFVDFFIFAIAIEVSMY